MPLYQGDYEQILKDKDEKFREQAAAVNIAQVHNPSRHTGMTDFVCAIRPPLCSLTHRLADHNWWDLLHSRSTIGKWLCGKCAALG